MEKHEIMKDLKFGKHDSLMIDLSGGGPKLRKNLGEVIEEG